MPTKNRLEQIYASVRDTEKVRAIEKPTIPGFLSGRREYAVSGDKDAVHDWTSSTWNVSHNSRLVRG